MASKKKAKGKKTAARKKVPKLRTSFMAAFTARFIRNPTTKALLWPTATLSVDTIAQNISDLVSVLGKARTGVPPTSGGTTSFRDQVADFVINEGWPLTPPIPAPYSDRKATVHLVEMAVIVDRMLEAVNEGSGGGGSGSNWPPHLN